MNVNMKALGTAVTAGGLGGLALQSYAVTAHQVRATKSEIAKPAIMLGGAAVIGGLALGATSVASTFPSGGSGAMKAAQAAAMLGTMALVAVPGFALLSRTD